MILSLDGSINYIVSGIERSGTSLLMQMLDAGGMPIGYDQSRPADRNNPKGYYELAGGKIINRLMEGSFPLEPYRGKFIKVTAYGIKFLPAGRYRIVYSERNIEEVLDSMEKMAKIEDEDREETKRVFLKLNRTTKALIRDRDDMEAVYVNYNTILGDPRAELEKIRVFFAKDAPALDLDAMVDVVDPTLYRQRRK